MNYKLESEYAEVIKSVKNAELSCLKAVFGKDMW